MKAKEKFEFKVGIDRGMVALNFESPISWMVLSATEARNLANIILQKVERIEGGHEKTTPS